MGGWGGGRQKTRYIYPPRVDSIYPPRVDFIYTESNDEGIFLAGDTSPRSGTQITGTENFPHEI